MVDICHYDSGMAFGYKKKVWSQYAYLSGGSGKPKEQINNTPHLYVYACEYA